MILHSNIGEFKAAYPSVDTVGFEKVFRLNDGRKNAFVVLTRQEGYPKIFNKDEYPSELLEKEIEGILERYYYTGNVAAGYEKDFAATEKEAEERIKYRRRIQTLSNIIIFVFFVLAIMIVLKGAGLY